LRLFRAKPDERLLDLLEESASNAKRTTALLREMLEDYPERRHLAREILKCEQDGDRVAHDIIHRLNESGVRSPWPSGDVYQLTSALDDIVDYAEEAADSLGLYGIEAPMAQAEELAQLLEQSGEAVADAVAALRNHADLPAHLVRVHQLENEGDRVSREAIASLFAKGIDPMVVIRWKDIFESLEEAIDSCETAAHLLEGIALKNGG
jgi:uncharacterized protein